MRRQTILLLTVLSISFVGFSAVGCGGGFNSNSSFKDGDPNNPTNPSGTDPNQNPSDNAQNNSNSNSDPKPCKADRVGPVEKDSCKCTWLDCEATKMKCECDVRCYVATDCAVDGNGNTNDNTIGSCGQKVCTPETDTTKKLECTFSECAPDPNVAPLNPVSSSAAPPQQSTTASRSKKDIKVLFSLDDSGSMGDNQAGAACAITSFFNSAEKGQALFSAGVLDTEVLQEKGFSFNCDSTPTYTQGSIGYKFTNFPELLKPSSVCDPLPASTCNYQSGDQCDPSNSPGSCPFEEGGDWVTVNGRATQDQINHLTSLFRLGNRCSNKEMGLEKVATYLFGQVIAGNIDRNTNIQVAAFWDEDTDGDLTLPALLDRTPIWQQLPGFTPRVPSTNESLWTRYINDYIYFFTQYFTNITVHGLVSTGNCGSDSQIISAVVNATGGHLAGVCECGSFEDFFDQIGITTGKASTSLCFPKDVKPDPQTIEVYHLGNSNGTCDPKATPKSNGTPLTSGWTYNEMSNCIEFDANNNDFGNYCLIYDNENATAVPLPPTACIPQTDPAILENTISVKCDGSTVPQNSSEGYTLQNKGSELCFTFYGTYETATCNYTVEYF